MKKALSLLLVVLMLVGMLPMTVLNANAAAGNYELVTDVSKLSVDDKVIIAAKDYNYALSTNQKSSNRGADTITKADGILSSVGDSVQELTLKSGTTTGTYAFYTGSGYLYAASSSGNQLKTQNSVTANSSWTITIANDGTASIVAKQSSNRNVMQYNPNNGSPLFACYASASQQALCLYKYVETTTEPDTPECTHENQTTTTVDAACTEDGSITVKCDDCGNTISTTVIPATGHNFVDGVCSCGEKLVDLSGDYYIAAKRNSGNYWYMTNNLGTASAKRYQAVDTGLTTLPASITAPTEANVFTLVRQGDGTYKIYAKYIESNNYLGYTSAKSGLLVAEASAKLLTIEESSVDGAYIIGDGTNNLSLNSSSGNNYFAFYAKTQVNDLFLIPVEAVEVCQHPNTSEANKVDATCTTNGYSGDTVCSDCGTTVSTGEVIVATGHNYVDNACSVCGVAYVNSQKTTTIAVGDKVIIVSEKEDKKFELDGFKENYATGAPYVNAPTGLYIWNVVAGAAEGTFSFEYDGAYLNWKSDNSAETVTEKDANSSWTVEFDEDGNAIIVNAADNNRKLRWNASNPRFACYTSDMTAIQLYKVVEEGGEPEVPECEHDWVDGVCSKCELACEHPSYDENDNCTVCGKTQYEGPIVTPDPDPSEPVETECPHTNTTTTTVDATCTTAGSVTVTCDACKEVISEETIAAAHTLENGACTVCYLVVEPAVDTAYKFGMIQGNVSKTDVYYITGDMDGYYMATTKILAEAPNVYLETAEGGYYFYTKLDGVKKYINMVINDSHINGAFEDVASTVYEFDAKRSTITATVNGALQQFGTRNDMKYTTMGPVAVSYNGFFGQFYYYGAEEIVASAADGITQLKSDIEITYNGIDLPATVVVNDVTMNVSWSIVASDANAAKIEDGKLVIVPQAAAATYTLTATVTNGDDTATAEWNGKVVPVSTELADGEYVIWVNGKAMTTLASGHGYLNSADVTLTGDVLAGHTKDSIFTLTASNGIYTIKDANNNYLYSDMSYADSKRFNVGANPVSGNTWTVVAVEDGYYIYNVDRAGAIGLYTQDNTFGLYTDETQHSVLTLTPVKECAHENTTTTTTAATCTAVGSEVVTCDDCHVEISNTEIPALGHNYVDGICGTCGEADPTTTAAKYYIATIRKSGGNYFYMTTKLDTKPRFLAVDSGLTVLPESITKPEAGYVFLLVDNGDGTYSLMADGVEGNNFVGYSSSDGSNSANLVAESKALKLTLTENEDGTYSLHFAAGDGERYLSLNSTSPNNYFAFYKGTQTQNLTLIPVKECKHTNTNTETVDATCTADGSKTVTCADCNEVISTEVIPAGHDFKPVVTPPTCTEQGYSTDTCTRCGEVDEVSAYTDPLGHSFANGTCTACGAADPDYVPEEPEMPEVGQLKFSAISLVLQASLTANYKVSGAYFADGAYTNPYVTFDFAGRDTVVVTDYYIQNDGTYVFPLTGISPQLMNENIVAVIHAEYNGASFESNVQNYSIAKYCYSQLGKSTDAKFRTMLVDLLNYGAAAQIKAPWKADELVNAALTQDQRNEASTHELKFEDHQDTKYQVIDAPTVSWKAISLVLDSTVATKITFAATDISNLTVKFTLANGTELAAYTEDDFKAAATSGQYYIVFDKMNANQMHVPFYVTVYEGDTVVSNTLQYSIVTYVGKQQSKAEKELLNLMNAMLRYGDSAKAYGG